MNTFLSQDEIDALIVSAATPNAQGEAPQTPHGPVVLYNFRRPDRVSKEQLRSLHFLHDRFAMNVSTSLSAFLRAMTEVSMVSAEQFAYSEFLMSLPDPTAFYAVGLHPLDGVGALEINPAVAFAMVDRLLGGTGLTAGPNRALTEIEQNVVDSVVKILLETLSETWRPITDVQFRVQGRETRPQMLRVTGPNEMVILLTFDVRMGEVRGALNLCIPSSSIEAVSEKFALGWHRTRRQPTPEEESWLYTNLGRMPMPVAALLETTISARELLALNPGDVVSLGHGSDSGVEIRVGAVPRFDGRLARRGAGVCVAVDRVAGEPVAHEEVATA